ncbi:MAG: vWA domain-containing protein [Rikenellaceae bacterium]
MEVTKYTQSITQRHRTLFVIAIDQSGSMVGELKVGGTVISKAEMVARVANELIAELVERSRRSDGVRNYYDISIIGYSNDRVSSLLAPDSWSTPITALDQSCTEEVDVEREYIMADGSMQIFKEHVRRWVMPHASGSTPIYETLLTVRDIVAEWCSKAENRDSFPPIIFNITDGESTDCSYDDIGEIASQIKSISTNDGQTLLFNIHIASNSSSKSLIIPSLEEMAQWNECSRSALSQYNAASILPPIFNEALCQIKGVDAIEEARAMSYNCSATELITILNIGSISVKLR